MNTTDAARLTAHIESLDADAVRTALRGRSLGGRVAERAVTAGLTARVLGEDVGAAIRGVIARAEVERLERRLAIERSLGR